MKIRPVGSELFPVDEQTDRHDEANSRFPQFRERAQKWNPVRFSQDISEPKFLSVLTRDTFRQMAQSLAQCAPVY